MKIYGLLTSLFLFLFISVACPPVQAQDQTLLERDYLLGTWNGKRSTLEDDGLSLELIYTVDLVTNHSGGLKGGSIYLANIDLTATLDTEKAGLWENGTFFVYFLNNHGGHPTEDYVGDLQGISNIETAETTRLYQLWYEHLFDWNGTLSVLIGQHDMNSEFNVTEYGGSFINSSFGIEPDISANAPVSIFSVAAPALRLKWAPNDSLYFMAAIYDGDPGAPDKNKNGMRWRLSSDEGAMTIYEMGYTREDNAKNPGLPGTYKLGFWYHTDDFADVVDLSIHEGNYGLYFVADQMLLPTDSGKGLGMFLQVGFAPDDRNLVDFYIGTGFNYFGLIPGRDSDTLGLAIAHASISDKLSQGAGMEDSETTVELTYSAQVTPWLRIQPDVQIVFNPGADPTLDNAIVSLLRFETSF